MKSPSSKHIEWPRIYDFVTDRSFGVYLSRYVVNAHNTDVLRDMDRSAIIAPVHRSMEDTLLIANTAIHLGQRVNFLAKKEMWKIPLLGYAIEKMGAIAIDRDKPMDSDTVSAITRVIDNNGLLGIFPEGTSKNRGDNVERKNLKRSIGAISLKWGLPIIPVGISGTEKDRRGDINIVFGDIIIPDLDLIGTVDLNEPRTYVSKVRNLMDDLHKNLQAAQDQAVVMS